MSRAERRAGLDLREEVEGAESRKTRSFCERAVNTFTSVYNFKRVLTLSGVEHRVVL